MSTDRPAVPLDRASCVVDPLHAFGDLAAVSQSGPSAGNRSVSPVANISLSASTHRRMKSSALSASGVSDSVGEGVDELVVGSGICGVGSGSPVHPASRRGPTTASASARRTCMKLPSRDNVCTPKLPINRPPKQPLGKACGEPPPRWRQTTSKTADEMSSAATPGPADVMCRHPPSRPSRCHLPPPPSQRCHLPPPPSQRCHLPPPPTTDRRLALQKCARGGPLGPPLVFPLVPPAGVEAADGGLCVSR